MKRIANVAAVLLFIASFASAAEQSPDRSHVRIVNVPRQCLESGAFEEAGVKYTCTKVDAAEVWNEAELRKFEKEIFDAYKQVEPTRIGLVVRQDTRYTTERVDYKPEVAGVEQKDGYKYRYSRR